MFRLVLQSIRQRRVQSVALVLTIAVSAGAFVALFLLGGGTYRGIELSKERSGAQILCVPNEAADQLQDTEILFTGAPVGAYMDASLADQMKEVAGVKDVTIQFYGQTLNESCCSADAATRLIGFDAKSDWVIKPFCDIDLSNGLENDEVVVGCHVTGYSNNKGKILGQEVKVKDVLDETGSYLDNSILMSLEACRNISKQTSGFSHLWEKYGEPDKICSAILVKCDEADTAIVASKLKRYVKGDYTVLQQQSILSKTQKSFEMIFSIMAICGVVLVIASILQLVARFTTLVWDRRSELALFRALGATKSNLRTLIFGEAMSLTILGCVLGAIFGALMYRGMLTSLKSNSAFPFSEFDLISSLVGVLLIILCFVIIATLTIIWPLHQSSKIEPASAMSQVDLS